MPQTPTGVTLGAYLQNPDLLDLQAKAQLQQQLAQALAQSRQEPVSNPNPAGAFIQGITSYIPQIMGMYLAKKTSENQNELTRQTMQAQMQQLSRLFPSEVGADSQGNPVQRSAPGAAGGLNIPGVPSDVAIQTYLSDPQSWTKAYLSNYQVPEALKQQVMSGITPAEIQAHQQGVNLKDIQTMAGPGQTLLTPGRAPINIPTEQGLLTQWNQQGQPSQALIPGALESKGALEYQQGRARGQAGLETTLTTGYDPVTGQFRNQTQAQSLGQAGLPPQPSPATQMGLQTQGRLAEAQGVANIQGQQKNVDQWSTDAESGYAMQQTLKPQIAQLDAAMKAGTYGPGVLADFKGSVGRYLEAAGFDKNSWVQQNIFNRSFSQESRTAAMQALGNKLGVGVSDADVSFIMDNLPKVQDSPLAAKAVLATLDKLAGTKVSRYDQWSQLKQVAPSATPDQFNRLWQHRQEEHPDMVDRKTGINYIWNVVTNQYQPL